MPDAYAAFPRLIALTDQARRAAGTGVILLENWPFRVGREARSGGPRPISADRRQPGGPQLNDLYLREEDQVFHVSREHFRIEQQDDGFELIECRSLNGTIVEGVAIGGDRSGGRIALRDHDVIIIGSATSPYIFKFRVGA